MKHFLAFFSLALALVACSKAVLPGNNSFDDPQGDPGAVPVVTDPITVSSPEPKPGSIQKISLTPEQQDFASAGHAFALKSLALLYGQGASSFVFSPLSLQYALAMVVNGASGETAAEITRALGFGSDVEALNAYCNLLMNQLPALDEKVRVKLADALVVDSNYPLLPSFVKQMEEVYYAPVEYMSFAKKGEVADRINEWAHRNTNGLIFPFLDESALDQVIAVILNALYFKAPWGNTINGTMFLPDFTLERETFYKDGGGTSKVNLMRTSFYFGYGRQKGYRMVEIPYADGKFAMYVLLPDAVGKQGLKQLVDALEKASWKDLTKSLTYSTLVNLRLPKFETSSRFELSPMLQALGIRQAFGIDAAFDRMFAGKGSFFVSNVLQKARIKVTEWGTEAAAVTAIMMASSPGPGTAPPPEADFFCDHPFAYVIAERSSGTILFEGIFTGE